MGAYHFGDDISVYVEDLEDYRAVTPNVATTTEHGNYRCVTEDVQATIYDGDDCRFVVSGLRMKVGFFEIKHINSETFWYGTTEVGTLHVINLSNGKTSTRDFGVEADIRVSTSGEYVIVVAVDDDNISTLKATLYKVKYPNPLYLYDTTPPMSVWTVHAPEVDIPPLYNSFNVVWQQWVHGEVVCSYTRGLCSHPDFKDRFETDLSSGEYDQWQEWLDEQADFPETQYQTVEWTWKLS